MPKYYILILILVKVIIIIYRFVFFVKVDIGTTEFEIFQQNYDKIAIHCSI